MATIIKCDGPDCDAVFDPRQAKTDQRLWVAAGQLIVAKMKATHEPEIVNVAHFCSRECFYHFLRVEPPGITTPPISSDDAISEVERMLRFPEQGS